MNKGIGLEALAKEVQRQREVRKDLNAHTSAMTAKVVDAGTKPTVALALKNGKTTTYDIASLGHEQIGEYLKIPKPYYERMLDEAPLLLADNINAWLAKRDERRMVRVLDGKVRAVLSNTYHPMDNYELMQAVLPVLAKHKVEVMSADVTERRLYIKAIIPALSEALPAGRFWLDDKHAIGHGTTETRIVSAITISNSEVGDGSLSVAPSVFDTWCTNLAVMREAAMRKYHVGRRTGREDDASVIVYKDDTRKADDKALWLKVRDTVEASFDEQHFRKAIAQMRNATEQNIEGDNLPAVIEAVGDEYDLPLGFDAKLLANLTKRADSSRFGVAAAVTALANTQKDYELSTELEAIGGDILTNDTVWKVIAKAGRIEVLDTEARPRKRSKTAA